MVSEEKFKPIVRMVIDNLEGGYYNPAWHSKGSLYSASGETMYGIDRKTGGTLNTSVAGKKFWSLIDANKNQATWKWNYQPPEPLRSQLKDLAGQIMYPHFTSLSKAYLKDTAKQIVASDNRLLFNFAYASWNGAGWFKKFATDINNAVDKGITDKDELAKIVIKSRTEEGLKAGSKPNSLIAQGGKKISDLFSKLKTSVEESTDRAVKYTKDNPLPVIITSAVVLTTLFFLIYKRKQIIKFFNTTI